MTHTRLAGFLALGLLIGGAVVPGTSFASSGCVTLTSSLSKGTSDTATNKSVSQLQDFLHTKGFLAVQPSGYFGTLTFKAVQDFQTSNKLAAVGIVGPLTRSTIQRLSCTAATSTAAAPAVSTPTNVNQQASVIAAISPAPVPPATAQVSLPYHSTTFSDWKGSWGTISTASDGTLLVAANASTTGAEAIFPASLHWTDYRYSADVSTNNGEITLIGRYRDDDNLLACTFVANTVSLIERINGDTKTVAYADLDSVTRIPAPRRTWVSMQVSGNTIGCSETPAVADVVYTTSNTDELTGGIGVRTYFSVPDDTTLGLYEVRVDPVSK